MWEDELGFEVEMGYEPIEVEREKRWRSRRSLGAGRSSSPLAHEPDPRQEPQRRKKNSRHISLHCSSRTEYRTHPCVSIPAFLVLSTKYEAAWTNV